MKRLKGVLRRLYLPIWTARYLLRACRDIRRIPNDALVMIGGGGVLMNNNYHFPLAIFLRTLIARICSRSIGFVGVSLGGHLNWMCRLLIKRSLLSADFVYVRDEITLSYLRETLKFPSAQIGPDCAFLGQPPAPTSIPASSTDSVPPEAELSVAINVMENSTGLSAMKFALYRQFISQLVVQNASRVKFIFFTTGWPADHGVAKDLAERLRESTNGAVKIEVAHVTNVNSLNLVLLHADLVIASRLHSAILSIKLELPPLCLNVSRKNSGFMNSIGLDDLVLDFTSPPPSLDALQSMAEANRGKIAEIVRRQRELGACMLNAVLSCEKQ